MMAKGLSLYQAEQKRLSSTVREQQYEKISENARRHQVNFLQNRLLIEEIIDMPDVCINEQEIDRVQRLLLWLLKTQESVELS
jgi:type III secretion system FlhB-like substrate exporter